MARRGNFNRGYDNGFANQYTNANDKYQQSFSDGYYENSQLNNDKATLEMLIDYVQADLTISGLMPKVLPDLEIKRIITENGLEWFYKNYQLAVMKSYYKLDREFIRSEEFTRLGYIVLPEEVENITRIVEIDNPSLFRIGIQAPNLSINFGVTNSTIFDFFCNQCW